MVRNPLFDVTANGNADRGEAARMRQAANDALQQLDFCIGFLAGANKGKIAERLAQNRAYIRERLLAVRTRDE
jgi:hypothetical protein